MAVEQLEKLVTYYHENKLSHVYLIETNNINKCIYDLKEVIKKFFCENEYEKECKLCNICNLIEQNYLPSLCIIEPDGNTIKKEQILDLKKKFSSIPIYTKQNVYIIQNAEKLNGSSANTMLKFVEEPADYILGFFVTNDINNVISTIKSRCEIIKVKYDESELNIKTIYNDENKDYFDVAKDYLNKLEVEKKHLILYNKDIVLNIFSEREQIRKLFKIILIIYEALLNNKLGKNMENNDFIFLDFLTSKEIIQRIKLVTNLLEDLEYNANIELLLNKFVIKLSNVL